MRRFLSVRKSSTSAEAVLDNEKTSASPDAETGTLASTRDGATERNASTTALLTPSVPLLPPNLKVKRVDYYYSKWSKTWKYKNMGDKVSPEFVPVGASTSDNDPWGTFCFVVVRTLPSNPEEGEPTFQLTIKSPYLLKACKDVMQTIPGISWNNDPLELNPQLLLTFLPLFEEYHATLKQKKNRSQEETYAMSSTNVLIEYLHKDYRTTIATIKRLTSHGEMTFEHLHAILIPRTLLCTTCPITGEPLALRLVSATRVQLPMGRCMMDLICEGFDVDDEPVVNDGWGNTGHTAESELRRAQGGRAYGWVQKRIIIPQWNGTVKINELNCYPLKYHAHERELQQALLARGRKWLAYQGVHHVHYKGTAVVCTQDGGCKKPVKYNVNSRTMIDRANFRRLNPNYELPQIKRDTNDGTPIPDDPNSAIPTLSARGHAQQEAPELEPTEDELMLASPIVYGFSLTDKVWLEFNVQKVAEIEWNDEAFENLVLPPGRKTLLRSLVEAHRAGLGFDDFVKGKGHGLVVNLFGPPGVGKTLSAEATSEHVRSPLYVVGGGDLGTTAGALDNELQSIFDIATSWKAIVLIDEADVFLEQRSLHDLERNAMVAVFLRHLEYYRGILFLTTNRVRTFDEAFLSRIHIALHFRELSHDAKAQIWAAFLRKVGIALTQDELAKLAERDINGRQIKNATRTATSLAAGRGEALCFDHLVETLDAMDDFTSEFKAMTAH
ncbi:ATPase family AAA domain-containing protein [Phanerochaete sordida]|uniref:ATPase family AAA domain-containing protein n=1 Tax=Phanerochaete sordida TaxID=48140 RepID=A0A9P3LFV9_9APHY|nr:ATPase family AAA domain-containing protein [Phanerochaete sordida]